MKKHTTLPVLLLCVSALAFIGCESSDKDDSASWNSSQSSSSQTTTPTTENSSGSSSSTASASDAVPFSSLNFCYGGFSGGGASHSGVNITSLSCSGQDLNFKYSTNLSAWGCSYTDHSKALACFFVQKSDGSWVGGKFDWISSSREYRSLSHCFQGYNGWSLSGVPNPTKVAFVIVHVDGKKRSNVISTTWSR